MSPSFTSIAAIVVAKSMLLDNPLCNSSKVRVPEPSSSSNTHKLNSLFLAAWNSASLSKSFCLTSCSRALFATSTITVNIKFNNPRLIVVMTLRKMTAVAGSSSMIGIEIWPQLSPATSC
eukprot:CAMPEP_0115738568 /NCGR_PEP_ID=MMETSP0272-20121206/88455_1 /TAXON_ID=71861 /ORGANISM="Scrippsiella trochoidea, Strain CCMP3099" /LENGTH=119 /DNA_ID=CAMNT_0003183015 /DNA_START=185 /DNA_END=541 /DNA_ORIENTATION=-